MGGQPTTDALDEATHTEPHPHVLRPRPEEPTTRPTPPDDLSKPWLQWQHATGDWGGVRPWLRERGFILDIGYLADGFTNLYGGLNTSDACTYNGLLSFSLAIETGPLGLWKGGTFFLDFQQIRGQDITESHVGDLQVLDNAAAPDRTQVAEYWYQQTLLDNVLRVKLGKMDANADFAWVEYGLEFINSSAGYPPNIPLPTYPDPALGVVLFIEPVDWFYVGGGVYDTDGSGDRWGFDTAMHGRDDSLAMAELGLRPSLPLFGRKLPGTYRVGGWYHSGTWEIFSDDPGTDEEHEPRTRRGNSGLYLAFDQALLPDFPDSDDEEQGLGAFFQFSWAPSAWNEISHYFGGGLQYIGLIPTRNHDITGIGLFHAGISGRLRSFEDRQSETAVEFFHKFQLAPWLSIKPDMQYIVNPGGRAGGAFVVGVRTEIAF